MCSYFHINLFSVRSNAAAKLPLIRLNFRRASLISSSPSWILASKPLFLWHWPDCRTESGEEMRKSAFELVTWRASIWRRKQCLSSLWTGVWYGEGKAKRPVDKHYFGTAVPRHPLCIRSWCKLLLARTLTVDRSDWHRLFGRHVARDLFSKWQ